MALDEKRALDNGLPSLWARLFDALDIKKNERVVQVGCGTGYYSAILSELVGPLGRVVAIDCEGAFIRRARQALQGYGNVEVIQGDGCKDLGGPADVIIVHAGFLHAHPLWLELATTQWSSYAAPNQSVTTRDPIQNKTCRRRVSC